MTKLYMNQLITTFSDPIVSGKVIKMANGEYHVSGMVNFSYDQNKLKLYYRAAEPADARLSVNGSGLPFPSPEHAFGNTNSGVIDVHNFGQFEFVVRCPNSYYKAHDIANGIGQGKILVEPMIYLTAELSDGRKKTFELELGQGMKYKSLTGYPGYKVRSSGRNGGSIFY